MNEAYSERISDPIEPGRLETEFEGKIHVVGISEMKVMENSKDVLVTYSLGSCIGLSLFDPGKRIGGLLHCLMPLSCDDPDRARTNPCMFTDSGISALISCVLERGAQKKNLIAKVAGASKMLDHKNMFKIGEQNYAILRKTLWDNEIPIAAEDVGGTVPRTMRLYLSDGRTTVSGDGVVQDLA